MAVNKKRVPTKLEDAYPLTKLQEGMLFHSELEPNTAMYHDVITLHLKGGWHEAHLRTALAFLVERHPILRTSFDLHRFSKPMQLVWSQVTLPLSIEDLRHLGASAQEERVEAWLESEKKRPLPWRHPPLVHFFIHLRSEETFQLTLSHHHALLDGWSGAILLKELFQLYVTLLKGKALPAKTTLNSAFRDFVAMEQATLASDATQEYWLSKLKDRTATRMPRLSTRQQAAAVKHAIQKQEIVFPQHETARLQQLATTIGVPLKSVLLAAHLKVLSVLNNHSDILTGLVSHGRPETVDGERVLGLFLNTLPFRVQIGCGSWLDLIKTTFAAESELMPHRRYPAAVLQKQTGGSPLFETAFNYVHFHTVAPLAAQQDIQVLEINSSLETNFTFAANFQLDPRAQRLHLTLDYNAGEMTDKQIDLIHGYYRRALQMMCQTPSASHRTASLLGQRETQHLLSSGNNTSVDYPRGHLTVPHLFERQVQNSPDSIAIVQKDQCWTYNDLNRQANQLAHYLQSLGIGPEMRVGVCLKRSPAIVICFLGILKAGAVYVPLDAAYPQERLTLLLQESDVALLLTQDDLIEKIGPKRPPIFCLDKEWAAIQHQPDTNPCHQTVSANLAYVIFTSGSTGKPKGVMLTHRGLSNLTHTQIQICRIEASSRVLQFASPSLDLSVRDLVITLCAGATLCLTTEATQIPGPELLALFQEQAITVTSIPVSILASLVSKQLPHLQTIAVGGEPCSPDVVARWAPKRRFFNQYGPTEATVDVTSARCYPDNTKPSIGQPIANVTVYLLGTTLQPVPLGVPGEIYIGGVGVARGYHQRPGLTAARFVPHPFSNKPGERLYRTGDLARRLGNGHIDFLGRIDRQVKVRGFRIELGEIEAAIDQHPAVQKAVVRMHQGESGNKQLYAYIVSQNNSPAPSEFRLTLRTFLKERLPQHMLPAAYVLIPALPLTANGKIAYDALPAPQRSDLALSEAYIPPRTPLEKTTAEIWAEFLEVERVGIHDNFFDLGGHSLLATQVVSRLRHALQVDLPLSRLFEAPTVAELAAFLETAAPEQEQAPILPAPRDGDLPLSFAQQRLWFLEWFLPDQAIYNIPIAIRLRGSLNIEALTKAYNQIIARHEVLRTTYPTKAGEPIQYIRPISSLTIPLIDLREMPPAIQNIEQRRLASAQLQAPFDLAEGPLLRFSLLQLDNNDYIAILCMHHIVSDGWSMNIFLQELATLYNDYLNAQPTSLPELPLQYADFALWQRTWLQGKNLKLQLSYWRQKLASVPSLLSIPTDKPRPTPPSFKGRSRSLTLSPTLLSKVKQLGEAEGCTLFITLLAAFKVLLHRYAGQENILVGTPIAGRNRAELEGLIGFFVNTLVLATDLSGDPGFREALQRVRQVTLEAYAHQDLPFDKLVEELKPERHLNHAPLFQVMFVLQNTPLQATDLQGLHLTPVELTTRESAKFDLSVHLWEQSDGINGRFVYNTALFEPQTIAQMIRNFQTLLESIVAAPDTPLSALRLLDPSAPVKPINMDHTTPSQPGHREAQLLDQLEELSDEEVQLLLKEMSAEARIGK